MQSFDESFELLPVQELHFVEEQRYTVPTLGRRIANREKDVCQVQGEVGVVGGAWGGVDIQASGPRTCCVEAHGERLEHRRRVFEAVRPACLG